MGRTELMVKSADGLMYSRFQVASGAKEFRNLWLADA
jgi:hypothetical protein